MTKAERESLLKVCRLRTKLARETVVTPSQRVNRHDPARAGQDPSTTNRAARIAADMEFLRWAWTYMD
jgi:hypothetical protein